MQKEDQEILIAALKGMEVISTQVNYLLDGFEYLVSTMSTIDSSNLFQRQLKDGATSMAGISEQMLIIKKLITSINDGIPVKLNKPFKLEVINELILHMDMVRNLLKDYEIHPEGYSAVKIGHAMSKIKICLYHF